MCVDGVVINPQPHKNPHFAQAHAPHPYSTALLINGFCGSVTGSSHYKAATSFSYILATHHTAIQNVATTLRVFFCVVQLAFGALLDTQLSPHRIVLPRRWLQLMFPPLFVLLSHTFPFAAQRLGTLAPLRSSSGGWPTHRTTPNRPNSLTHPRTTNRT